jgi:hypothetical protein
MPWREHKSVGRSHSTYVPPTAFPLASDLVLASFRATYSSTLKMEAADS